MSENGEYWGPYKAFVRDRNDPMKRGRIRVFCPAVMGTKDDKSTWLDWALPKFTSSFFDLPPDKSGVWVEFEQGNPSYPVWTGRFLGGDSDTSSEAPQVAKDENPENRVIFTAAGHLIEISDKDDNKHIKITHSNGTTIVDLDKDGKCYIRSGAKIILECDNVHLGGEDPAEFVALADKTKARLDALQNGLDTHVHAVVFGACTTGGTTGTVPTPPPTVPVGPLASVAATKTKAV